MQKPSSFSSTDALNANTVSVTKEETAGRGEQKSVASTTPSLTAIQKNTLSNQEDISDIGPKIEKDIEDYEKSLEKDSANQPAAVQTHYTNKQNNTTESMKK